MLLIKHATQIYSRTAVELKESESELDQQRCSHVGTCHYGVSGQNNAPLPLVIVWWSLLEGGKLNNESKQISQPDTSWYDRAGTNWHWPPRSPSLSRLIYASELAVR